MSTKRNKYYKFNDSGLSQSQLVFMIKWVDDSDKKINYEGPFLKEEDAIDTLNDFLKRGLCSWIIKYDD